MIGMGSIRSDQTHTGEQQSHQLAKPGASFGFNQTGMAPSHPFYEAYVAVGAGFIPDHAQCIHF